ncbi:hypothetical protein ABEB36_014378 [Hypothenemus hampei]|uniref:Uncharacterized protein n=1 Tax=Hypothenemus hampei TaxID=57062 RepID=A0ABD1E4I2_HYPHA
MAYKTLIEEWKSLQKSRLKNMAEYSCQCSSVNVILHTATLKFIYSLNVYECRLEIKEEDTSILIEKSKLLGYSDYHNIITLRVERNQGAVSIILKFRNDEVPLVLEELDKFERWPSQNTPSSSSDSD